MPAPLIFVVVPALLAPVAMLLQRSRGVATLWSFAMTGLLAWLALWLPFNERVPWLAGLTVPDTFVLLGRVFQVEAGDRLALAFIFAQAALLFLVAGLGEPSPRFFGAGLGALGLLAAALFVRPFLFAALFLLLAAALAAVMLGGQRAPSGGETAARGALRYLVFTTLGVPFILLAGWVIEAASANPAGSVSTGQAASLLMFGFAVLLAVVPFHSWLPVVAQRSPPFAAAFVFTVMRQAVVFLLLTFMNAYPWLNQDPVIYRALTLGGGGMALAGAVLAFGQRNFGRLVGYVMMIEIGAVMLGIGLETRAGIEAALAALAVGGLALPLWAAGLEHLRRYAGGDDFEALAGAARRHPVAAAALVVALLSLAGFPLTAGFTARWPLLYQLAQIHPTAAIFLLLAMLSIALVGARGLAALLRPGPAPQAPAEAMVEGRLPAAGIAVYGIGFTVLFVIGLFPQWVLPAVAGMASVFAQFAR
jgi:formate hydrogenlyase subunit 3/multisubunit Na+/H+ antiporter MnhD subunit